MCGEVEGGAHAFRYWIKMSQENYIFAQLAGKLKVHQCDDFIRKIETNRDIFRDSE